MNHEFRFQLPLWALSVVYAVIVVFMYLEERRRYRKEMAAHMARVVSGDFRGDAMLERLFRPTKPYIWKCVGVGFLAAVSAAIAVAVFTRVRS